MLAGFAEAAAILDRADYREVARASARFLLTDLQRDGLLLRTYKDGQAKLNGYLEDYASLIDGLISLYEATGELEWIEGGITLAEKMINQFWDDEAGGFFFTGQTHEQLIVRTKEWLDNATPSGNSLAASALLRLSALTANDDYRRRATTVLRLMANQMRRYPSAFGFALTALDFYLSSPLEIVIVGNRGDARLGELARGLWQDYIPNRIVAICTEEFNRAAAIIPLFRWRNTVETPPTAYVCQAQTCQTPAHSAEEMQRQITASIGQ